MSKNRPNLRKIVLLVLIVAGFASCVGLVVRGCIACQDIREAPIWSPDGKWALTSITRECPVGLLDVTNYDVFVDLSPKPTAFSLGARTVRIFEDDDANEPPSISWTGPNKAMLKLRSFGSVRTSKHEIANIKFEYVIPQWIWRNLREIETKADKDSAETKFREWISNNATVESEPAVNNRPAK